MNVMPPTMFRHTDDGRRFPRPRVLSLIVLTTLPLLLFIAVIAGRGARDAEARVTEERVALAQVAALTASSFVDAQLAIVAALARTPDVADPYNRPDLHGFLTGALADHPDWESIDIVGPQGTNIASSDAAPETVSFADRPYFQQVMWTGRVAVGTAAISPRSGNPIVALAAPVNFTTGAFGVLVVSLSTNKLNDVLTTVRKDNRLQIVLLDAQGNTFAHAGSGGILSLASRRGRPEADAVLRGETGSRRAADESGVNTLVAYAPVPGVGWGVLVSQPVSVAFGPGRRRLETEFALLALVAFLTGAVGWYLGRRLARSYERELEALARAEEASRLRDEFLSAASHDLKTPLTTIKAFAQLMLRRARKTASPDAEWFSEGLERIDDSTSKMIAQLNELMDVGRLQTDRPLELDRQPTDLVALAHKAVAEQQQATERHRLHVEAAVPKLVGEWDSARLERVLSNLLSNAVKYSPNGGDVTVTLTWEPAATGGWAVVAIRDQGLGIPAADLPRVFERFHRAGNVVGKVAGTGIGLAGVRQIVEQHGGTITVQSREGEGSTFRLRLPLSQSAPVTNGADPHAAPAPTGTLAR